MPTLASLQPSPACPVIQRANRALHNARSQAQVLASLRRELCQCQDCTGMGGCPSWRVLAQWIEAASRPPASGGRCV